MPEVTLSSKNQIVIPKEARQKLGVKAGDKLIVTLVGSHLTVMKKPKSFLKALQDLKVGPYGEDYLEKERADWDR